MKKISLYTMAALYVLAGVNHFINPAMYMAIMPPYIGWHKPLVLLSGAFEIILGVLLLPKATRRLAAWGIIALLIAVFPANIQTAVAMYNDHKPMLWLSLLRLPIQFLLIWWAYTYTRPMENATLPTPAV